MLTFQSASVRIANTERAVDECMEMTFEGKIPEDLGVVMFNATIGHKLDRVAAALKKHAPKAIILGTSCGGVTGREGAGEALTNLALMTLCGPKEEYAAAWVDDMHAGNCRAKGKELAQNLTEKLPGVSVVYLIAAGMDVAANDLLDGFEQVFGQEVPIFGGTSSDNYKAITTYQYIGDKLTEHGAWAVGFADPTLQAAARATHGFSVYGEPMEVTKTEDNRIIEFDGEPAWDTYTKRLGLIPEDGYTLSVIAAGALAEELPPDIAKEYHSTHILRGAFKGQQEGAMYMAVTARPGERFWLTTRDEDLIFSEQQTALDKLREQIGDKKPVAVFQADCLARGRTLFNKVMKDEIVAMMQNALLAGEEVPPWLGMYGFGEFCPLAGRNTFHTYTTSLLVLYR